MTAPFKCDEKVTIERNVGTVEPVYGTTEDSWIPFLTNYWAWVEDVLPGRAESTTNGLRKGVTQTRLRMEGAAAVTLDMRVVLHNRGNKVMGIISGPAMLNDRMHYEFALEDYAD